MAFRLWRCFLDWMFVRAGAKPPRSLEEEKKHCHGIINSYFVLYKQVDCGSHHIGKVSHSRLNIVGWQSVEASDAEH